MLIYLDQALEEVRAATTCRKPIMLEAVERVRPKMMTVTAIMAGLVTILWSTGTGSGGDAAHRRPHDRWHGLVDRPYPARDPRDLCFGGHELRSADVAHLSPLGFKHIGTRSPSPKWSRATNSDRCVTPARRGSTMRDADLV